MVQILQVKPRLFSGERKLSNQNQHLFEAAGGSAEQMVEEGEGDRVEALVSILLLLLQAVAGQDMVLTDEEERRWSNFTQLKRRVNKVNKL
jgi:hypothetical protein